MLASDVPPPFTSEVVLKGLAFMAENPAIPTVWMGDFNLKMNPTLDRPMQTGSSSGSPQHTRLSRMLTEFAMTDVWRWQNLSARAYTCHSTSYNTMSRIDFVFVSNSLLPTITGSGIAPRALSDHSPRWITVSILRVVPIHIWRLNPFWLSVVPDLEGIARELHYILNNPKTTETVPLAWDVFKNQARRILSSRINRFKQSSKLILQLTTDKLQELETAYALDPSSDNLQKVKLQTRVVSQMHIEKNNKCFFANNGYLNMGNKQGKCWRA